jgi:hypothetical protein
VVATTTVRPGVRGEAVGEEGDDLEVYRISVCFVW